MTGPAAGRPRPPETPDEAALAPFFRAARTAEAQALPPGLVADILADAAAVSAARHPALPERRRAPAPRRPLLGRLLAPFGGWPGAAVLGTAAAVGFWVGVAGSVSIDATGTVRAGSAWTHDLMADTTADQGADQEADPVASFFDLAALEG